MSRPVSRDSLVRRAASGGRDAMWPATSSAWSISLPCGTSHCASPMRWASCAVSGKPMARRIALPRPTQRASRVLPPYAGRIPSVTWGSRHSARSDATSRSQQKVTMQPMPTAKPLTAPTIGLGKLPRTSKARPRRLAMLLMKSAADSSVCVLGSLRFAPAEKAPPASSPVRTTQRIASSSSMAVKYRAMPSLKSAPHALRASGRLRVTMPIASRRSNVTGMAASCTPGIVSSRRQCGWRSRCCQLTAYGSARPSWNRSDSRSVAADHDVRGFDHRIGVVAGGQPELVDRFVRDRRGDDRAARQLDPHVRRRRALLHLDDSPLEDVPRAELHGAPRAWIDRQIEHRIEGCAPPAEPALRGAEQPRQLAEIADLEVGRRHVRAARPSVAVHPCDGQARFLRALDVV